MCYNGGCGMPDDDRGKGHAGVGPHVKPISEKTLSPAAKAFGMSAEESKTNILELLEKEKDEGHRAPPTIVGMERVEIRCLDMVVPSLLAPVGM